MQWSLLIQENTTSSTIESDANREYSQTVDYQRAASDLDGSLTAEIVDYIDDVHETNETISMSEMQMPEADGQEEIELQYFRE